MNRTIIMGLSGSGKSLAAKILVRNQRACYLDARDITDNDRHLRHWLRFGIPKEHARPEAVIIDNIKPMQLEPIAQQFYNGPIIIEGQRRNEIQIEPDVILVCNDKCTLEYYRGVSLVRRFNLIWCDECGERAISIKLKRHDF